MYIPKVKYTNIEQWDSELMQTYFSWFGYKFFGDEKMDWINHVMSRANQILFTMCNLYNGIDLMNKNKETKLYQDLHSIYVYSMKNLFPFSDSEMHGENVVFSNFQSDIKELLDKNEQNKLLNLVNNRNYPECRKLLKDKIEKSANFYALIIQLNDFILDLRNILNNYRTFKIQLREARVLKLNYICYLLEEWRVKQELIDQLENIKEMCPLLQEIAINWQGLLVFINQIVYNTYIIGFGKKFPENFKGKLWIYKGVRRKVIVISNKNEDRISYTFMTTDGIIINNLDEEEREEIEIISKEITKEI